MKTMMCLLAGALSLLTSRGESATFLSLDSQPGDYIGQGQQQTLTTVDGSFTATRNFDNGVSVSFNGGTQFWSLDFAAPNAAALAVGTYEGATRFPFQSPTEPGLDVAGDGRGCNELTVNFQKYGTQPVQKHGTPYRERSPRVTSWGGPRPVALAVGQL